MNFLYLKNYLSKWDKTSIFKSEIPKPVSLNKNIIPIFNNIKIKKNIFNINNYISRDRQDLKKYLDDKLNNNVKLDTIDNLLIIRGNLESLDDKRSLVLL